MTGDRREFPSRSARNLSVGAEPLCQSGDRGHAPGAAPHGPYGQTKCGIESRPDGAIVSRVDAGSPHRATSPTESGVDFPARFGFVAVILPLNLRRRYRHPAACWIDERLFVRPHSGIRLSNGLSRLRSKPPHDHNPLPASCLPCIDPQEIAARFFQMCTYDFHGGIHVTIA